MNSRYLISGDFNVIITKPTTDSKIFSDLLRSHNLHFLYREPTRLDAYLDNIVTGSNSQNKYKAAWNLIRNEAYNKVNSQESLIKSDSFNDFFINAASQISINIISNSFGPAIELLKKYLGNNRTNDKSLKWKIIQINDVKRLCLQVKFL